jgi:DNA-binding GntR family transcriptional regulator
MRNSSVAQAARTVVFEKTQYKPLNDLVCEQIKQKIIDNELRPGDKLDVTQLCDSLGVSRTPVINALKELEQKGYVVINPRSGSYVREHTKEEIETIFDFREALECLVVKKAIRVFDKAVLRAYETKLSRMLRDVDSSKDRLDEFFALEVELHQYLIRLCPSIVSDKMLNLIELTKRIRKLHLRYLLETTGENANLGSEIQIHLDLVRAVLARDEHAAEQCIATDIRTTRDQIVNDLEAIESLWRDAPSQNG